MKKIKISHDLDIIGYGKITEGTMFKVVKFNSRFIYVDVSDGLQLRLARKRDCIIVY